MRRAKEHARGSHAGQTGSEFERRREFPILNLSRFRQLVGDLEGDPAKLPAFYCELEAMIRTSMDEVYRLAKSGEDDDRKMAMVALEYRARLVLERWKKQHVN